MTAPPPLRGPQQFAVDAALAAIQANLRSGLWVIPTGVGKTAAFLTLARILNVPSLVLVHRDTLVRQTVKSAATWWPEATVGVIQGKRDEWRGGDLFGGKPPDLVVGSVQSMHTKRLGQIPRDRFGLIIPDEAHRAVSKSFTRVIEHFDYGFLLGVTATPDRLDGIGLGKHFGREPLFLYSLKQAIDDKVLVPVRQYAINTSVNLDQVQTDAKGKFNAEDLSKTLNTPARNALIVQAYQKYASDRRAIVFAVDVEHVRDLTKAFNEAGTPAVAITGEDVEGRERDLADFAASKYRVAVNCEVLNEGFDDPAVSCVIMARTTKSKLFVIQSVGRGLRQAPGKKDCLVLDAVDVTRLHKLVSICNLLGVRKTHDAQGQDVLALAKVEEEERQVEEAKAKQLLLHFPIQWRLEEVSPWPELPSLEHYEADRPWKNKPATDKQLRRLHKLGLSMQRDITKGEASWLIDRAIEYDFVFPTPASAAQEAYLRRNDKWTEGISRRDASRLIGMLKQAETLAKAGR